MKKELILSNWGVAITNYFGDGNHALLEQEWVEKVPQEYHRLLKGTENVYCISLNQLVYYSSFVYTDKSTGKRYRYVYTQEKRYTEYFNEETMRTI